MKQPSLFLSLVVATLIVLLGYYRIFLGDNFFVHEDWLAVSGHTAGNKFSNGWRPDKGLGLSNFYGDPGMWHPWSLSTFLERIMPNRVIAYSVSVILLDLSAVFSILLFVRKFFPQVNLLFAAVLTPVFVFSFDASAQHYARALISMSAGIPLLMWLLFGFFQKPRWIHILGMAFLLWAVAFTGTLWSLTQLIMLGFVFSILYLAYFKTSIMTIFRRYLFLHILAVPLVLLLGAWVFYSFGLEQFVFGYVREKSFPFPGLSFIPQIKSLISYLCGFIPFEAISIDHNLAGLRYLPYRLSVSVIFVFCFLYFLGRKSENFWDFAIKGLLVAYFIHGILMYGKLIPAYGAVYSLISNKTSTLISMYLFVFSLQILMIIRFVSGVSAGSVLDTSGLCRKLQVLIAAITVGCYGVFFILCFCAIFVPGLYLRTANDWLPSLLPQTLGGYNKELLSYMISYDAHRYQELIKPQWFLFFVTSMLIAGVFIRDNWLKFAAGLPKLWIAFILLFNGVMLCWSFYPLSGRTLVWQRPEVKALKFEPTDRFYFVRYYNWDKTVEGFKRKWETGNDHGPRQNEVGYLEPPGLNISGFKSFTSRMEADFLGRIVKEAGYDYKRLYYGTNFVSSDLLDMAAVKYYFSDNKIDSLPPKIVPYAHFENLYIYKNIAVWPYFYLAQRLEITEGPIVSPVRGAAYVSSRDKFNFSEPSKDATVRLKAFHFGRMVFDYKGSSDGFLVIADAWHPFWKASKSSGEPLKIIKTNEVFKGVLLPAGEYELEVFFDTRPYLPGVWISLVAWILFVTGFIFAYRDCRCIGWLK